MLIQRVIFESYLLNLVDLLKVCRQENCDKIVNLMLDHNAFGMHMRNYTQKVLLLSGEDVSPVSLAKANLDFMKVIYQHCSIEVTTRFIQSEWAKKSREI